MRRRSLGVRHHALLVRRAHWTNDVHSSSFVVCVGIFEHAQNCARRMNVGLHARRTPAMRRARWTNAMHTGGTRGAHAGHALCSSTEVRPHNIRVSSRWAKDCYYLLNPRPT